MNCSLYEDTEPLTVDELKKINFDQLSKHEQLKVKQRGRPTPRIDLSKVTKTRDGKTYTRRFKDHYFENHEWLCSSAANNALYCFPCLIFNKECRSNFVRTGFRNIGCLATRIREHENTKNHIDSVINLKLLSDSQVEKDLCLAQNKSIILHNSKVKRNLEILNDVVSAIFFLGAHDLPFRGLVVDLLDLMSTKSQLLRDHLSCKLGSACKLTSPDIQNQILDSVVEVYRQQVISEVSQASCVTVMVEESVDVAGQTQLVLIFRYISDKSGLVVDRFWGYFNPHSVDAYGISSCIIKELKVVIRGNNNKLIFQTFGGFKVMYEKEKEVQSKLKKVYNMAHYTCCHCNQMQLVEKEILVGDLLLRTKEESKYLETFHLVSHQLFRKEFYLNCSASDLKKLCAYVSDTYSDVESQKLKAQLDIYYERDMYNEECLLKLIKIFKELNINKEFSEIIKLAQILKTIPMNLTDVKKKFSSITTLISKHCHKMVNNKITALGILLIEKDIVSGKEISEKASFQTEVVDNFIRQKPRKMDFFYKCKS